MELKIPNYRPETYNLEYWVGSKFVESPEQYQNKPILICKYGVIVLRRTDRYRLGKFKLRNVKTKKVEVEL